MPSRKAIKRRIVSVKTTKQIVKAMNMVAATKLSKTKALSRAARPLFDESCRVMKQLKDCERAQEHVFFKERPEGGRTAYVVINGDRGYCGSYNTNVATLALEHMETGKDEAVFAIGLRGREFFQRRNKQVLQWYRGICEKARYEEVKEIANTLISLYLSGEVDEVYVAYTRFLTVLTYEPTLERILPLGDGREPVFTSGRLQYEPDIGTILEHAVPQYVSAFLYGAILESGCCEQAARMVSMDAATKSAQEIIEDLTRLYNRKRQAHITQEITEIIGGANLT